ncbi:MAG: hypothetical protein IJQ28_02730, partial [Clostridia bacterium]|nr:hypothetical protein [Clostridia bacterium]
MKKVKILSIILSVAMIFSLLTVSVSAEATYAVSAANATVAPGGDVDVAISIEAPSCHGIGFALNYESAALTYKDYTLTASNGVTDAEVSVDTTTTGVVDVTVLSDGKAYTGAFITITFTAKSTIEGTNEETNITTGANMNGFLDDGYLPVDNSNISFGSAKVTIQAAHTAPTVTAVITGSGKVGTELSGEVTEDEGTSKVVDSWSLTPTIAYEWSKVVNEEKVVLGTEATYTPKKEDRNAEITLTITATVTGDGVDDDTATGTGTDTITIVKNDDDNYKPTVTLDTVDEESVAGRDIVISFT